jgi:hypothetical protein
MTHTKDFRKILAAPEQGSVYKGCLVARTQIAETTAPLDLC